jgi:hypothetical protein
VSSLGKWLLTRTDLLGLIESKPLTNSEIHEASALCRVSWDHAYTYACRLGLVVVENEEE